MARILIWLLLLLGLGTAVVWLSNNPGTFSVEWMGYEITAPVMFMVIAVFSLFIGTLLLVSLVARVFNIPFMHKVKRQQKNHDRGIEALTLAITSIATSDMKNAVKYSEKSKKLLGDLPLIDLLDAQISYRKGKKADAEKSLKAMLEHDSTSFLAARALSNMSIESGDNQAAIAYALEARSMRPENSDNIIDLLNLYLQQNNWHEAEVIITQGKNRGAINKDKARYLKALVYAAKASYHESDNMNEKALILRRESFRMAPELTDNAVRLARLYENSGNKNKAFSVLRKAWGASPHPDIFEELLENIEQYSEKKQARNLKLMLKSKSDHIESHIARARLAKMHEKFEDAISHAEAALGKAQQARIYLILASISEKMEEAEKAKSYNEIAIKAESDPAWTCKECGYRAGKWSLNCSGCGAFDSIEFTSDGLNVGSSFEVSQILYDSSNLAISSK